MMLLATHLRWYYRLNIQHIRLLVTALKCQHVTIPLLASYLAFGLNTHESLPVLVEGHH